MEDPSVLLSHEAAFALGQIGSKIAKEDLLRVLRDASYHPVLRHEVKLPVFVPWTNRTPLRD